MDTVRATVLQRGEMILTGVTVSFLHGTAFVQDSSWSGLLLVPPEGYLAHGGPYELRLDDGRHAFILVKDTREDDGQIIADFVGVGAFPHPE